MARMRRGALAAGTVAVMMSMGTSATPARASGCAHAERTASAASLDQLSGAIACLLNRERRRMDLAPLAVSRRLAVAAYRHAADMRDHRYFSHTSVDGRSFVDRIREARYLEGHEDSHWTLGETLAWSTESQSTPSDLVGSLMNSPSHRGVILDARHRELGIGLVRGTPTGHQDGATLTIDYGSLTSPEGLRSDPPAERPGRRPDKPGKQDKPDKQHKPQKPQKQDRQDEPAKQDKPDKRKESDRPAEPAPEPPAEDAGGSRKPGKDHPRATPRRASDGELHMSSVIVSRPSGPGD